MKNMLHIISNTQNNESEQRIFHSESERREYFDARMCEAFEDALAALEGRAELITHADYKDVRASLLDTMGEWMSNVGSYTKTASAYLRRSDNNSRDEISSHFFGAACMNNRLYHYLTLTALKGAHVALKSLQESAVHATLDLLPRKEKQTGGNPVQMVDMEAVERTLSSADSCNPQYAASCRQDLGVFWRMLYEKPFLQIMAFIAQPLGLTRKELANRLLSSTNTVELFEEIEGVFASILSDKTRIRAAMKPIKVMVDRYEPDPEHVQNPDKLVNLLYRYTITGGALDKFYIAFKKAIAA